MDTEQVSVDVAIVGGGVSGMTAAHRLYRSGVDSLVVLEALDRVGGRTMQVATSIEGHTLDGGGEIIGPGQDALFALLTELELPWFDMHFDGLAVYSRGDERGTFSGQTPPLSPDEAADHHHVQHLLDALVASVSLEAPWDTPDAQHLDRLSAGAWLDANARTLTVNRIFSRKVTHGCGAPASQVSFLYFLYYLATCGTVSQSLSAAAYRIQGGANSVTRTIAAELGGRVRLGTPVTEVDQSSPDRVVVRGQGIEVSAKRVIVAMPPAHCRPLHYRPPLPARRNLLQNVGRGAPAFKFHAIYREPFWRRAGFNGYAYLDNGTIPSIFDASPPDGSIGVLMLWLLPFIEGPGVGDPATIYDDPAIRRQTLLELLASWWGPEALEPLEVVEIDWLREPYSLGAEFPMPPGVLTAYGPALRAPVDRIHWGSAETSIQWVGYINGAVEAGERTAREVLAAL